MGQTVDTGRIIMMTAGREQYKITTDDNGVTYSVTHNK